MTILIEHKRFTINTPATLHRQPRLIIGAFFLSTALQSIFIRIAAVEDDPLFLHSLTTAIDKCDDMALVDVASSVADAKHLMKIRDSAPDVLVVDLGLPDGSGIDVIARAHVTWPSCAIMVSTTFADEENVVRSIEAGASGYLLKDSSGRHLAEDIRSLHGGGSPINPMIARHILRRFRMNSEAPQSTTQVKTRPESKGDNGTSAALSARELDALGFIAKGFTYDEVATLMGVSRNTVMTFVRRIYGKLEVKSKAEAIHEAYQRKLINH